jgi:hypothetical protein
LIVRWKKTNEVLPACLLLARVNRYKKVWMLYVRKASSISYIFFSFSKPYQTRASRSHAWGTEKHISDWSTACIVYINGIYQPDEFNEYTHNLILHTIYWHLVRTSLILKTKIYTYTYGCANLNFT